MAISFTRPDPSSPSSVASASFTTARKGFESTEVREFLRMVAAELARLQERERFLERELRTAQRSTSPTSVALDEELVTKMLGEEAARILHTARDAASQIKARSEDNAARLLREAGDEAQRLREAAEIESARRRSDATADAESELEMAKQQGREMVNEARAYRERVLNELARRREIARQQIEQLVHGRDRLLQSFERSRLVAVDVMAELTPLGEPSEYVNLSPTTGPVPLMVPNMPRPPERARAEHAEPEADVDPTVGLAAASATLEAETGSSSSIDRADPVTDDVAEDASADRAESSVTVFVDDDFDSDRQAVDATELDTELGTELDTESTDVTDATDDRVTQLDITPHDPATTDAGDDREPAPVVSLFAVDGERRGTGREPHDVSVDPDDDLVATVASSVEQDEVIEVVDFGGRSSETAVLSVAPDAVVVGAVAVGSDVASDSGHDDSAVTDSHESATDDVDPDGTTVLARTSADDLFARLRAARADSVAERAVAAVTEDQSGQVPAAGEPDNEVTIGDVSVFASTPDAPKATVAVVDSPFARRDEALTPLILSSARKLKRVLADEQNDVLHALRRKQPVRDLAMMLASESEQAERYGSSIAAELIAAATAGAMSVGASASAAQRSAKKPSVTSPAVDTLRTEVVAPLRERLARCVSDADGDNVELASLVRLAYREWKNQRIDEHLDDVARTAFGRGAFVGVAPGSPICWLVDPKGPACADAEDNALGGTIRAGDAFPTDHKCAPAHSGCRCMIAPVR